MWLLGNLTLHMRYSLNFDQMVWIGRLNFDGGGHVVFPRPHVLLIDFLCIFHLVGLHHLTLNLAMLTYFHRAFFRNCGGGKSNEVSRRGVGRVIIEHDCCIRWPLLSKGQWKVNLVWLGREKTIKFRCLGWEGDIPHGGRHCPPRHATPPCTSDTIVQGAGAAILKWFQTD